MKLLPGMKIRFRTNPDRWSFKLNPPKEGSILTLEDPGKWLPWWSFKEYPNYVFMLNPAEDDFEVVTSKPVTFDDLPVGTVFRYVGNNTPHFDHAPLVVTGSNMTFRKTYRMLAERQNTGFVVNQERLSDVQILGHLPSDRLDSTDLPDVVRLQDSSIDPKERSSSMHINPKPPKKGAPMFKSFLMKTAGVVLFATVAGSSASFVNTISETPHLELGDWQKVTSCDSCAHVLGGPIEISSDGTTLTLCPKCGGEAFSTRKAQALTYDPWFGSKEIHGWEFSDGSRSPISGNFVIPSREVRTK